MYKIPELTADRLQSNYNYQNGTDLDVNIDRYHQINKQTEFLGCLDVNIVMIPLIELDFQNAGRLQQNYQIHTDLFC